MIDIQLEEPKPADFKSVKELEQTISQLNEAIAVLQRNILAIKQNAKQEP